MTPSELQAAVDVYFASHLDSEYWSSLTTPVKNGAISMAINDILAELPGVTIDKITDGSFAFNAIAEQSVYLARNYSSLTEGKVVTSEGLEGISTGYTIINDKVGISFRASLFIKKAKTSFLGATAKIARG